MKSTLSRISTQSWNMSINWIFAFYFISSGITNVTNWFGGELLYNCWWKWNMEKNSIAILFGRKFFSFQKADSEYDTWQTRKCSQLEFCYEDRKWCLYQLQTSRTVETWLCRSSLISDNFPFSRNTHKHYTGLIVFISPHSVGNSCKYRNNQYEFGKNITLKRT